MLNLVMEKQKDSSQNYNESSQKAIDYIFELNDKENDLLSFNWKERLIYYYYYPSYFLNVLYDSIKTFSWKL